jgi:endonuclease/exonuclease/phosphatase family metal-dependent hydrolase
MRIIGIVLITFISTLTFGQAIDIMTYNIRYDNTGDGINQWSSRKDKVYNLIKKHDPEIFGVQEAMHNQMQDLKAALSDYDYVGVGRDDGKQGGEYSGIFFKKERFKVKQSNTFWLSETPSVPGSKNWDAAITRVATWAVFHDKKTNKEFMVINTHFDHIGKEARAKSAELLVSQSNTLAKSTPLIITGDFNCTREDKPYKVIMNQKMVPLSDPAPANPPGTFCSFKVNSIECRPIDYIFTSAEWKASEYKVITDNDGTHYPSDHLPVQVTLELK